MRIGLFQPDIPQNTGAIMRLCSCLNVPLDVIEPSGFAWNDTKLRRSGMDYMDMAAVRRHRNWEAYRAASAGERVLLMTTAADRMFCDFSFRAGDRLLFGSESAGVPEHVHAAADARLMIPMMPGRRSLNVAISAAIVLTEAMRQAELWRTVRPGGA